jgi:hypothetical protein
LDCEPLVFNAPGTFLDDCYGGGTGGSNNNSDSDGDGVRNNADNCDDVPNGPDQAEIPNVGNQTDSDSDGVGDACDNCLTAPNSLQNDYDNDTIGDACDDSDSDGVVDAEDNCVDVPNGPDQAEIPCVGDQTDTNGDGVGDACDPNLDSDGDGHAALDYGGDDCNDSDPTVYPGAEELSDGKDNNCDGSIDEGANAYHVAFSLDQNDWLPSPGQTVTVTAVVKDAAGATVPHDSIDFTFPDVSHQFAQYTNDPGSGDPEVDDANDFDPPGIIDNQITLTSNDYGGSITIHAEATLTVDSDTYLAQGDLTVPVDTDGDGLADAWEMAACGNLSTLTAANGDPDDDGLSNLEESRGFWWGPDLEEVPAASSGGVYQTTAWVPGSAPPQHFRSNPLRKDMFVKFSNYDVYNGFGSVFSHTACPDDPLDPDSLPECPYAIGSAFHNAGVDVHVVSLNFLPPYMGGDTTPWETNIEAVTVTNITSYNYGGDDGYTNKIGKRDWAWDTKGWSGIGNETTYGVGTRTYQTPLDRYFTDEPYIDDPLLGGDPDQLDNVDGSYCEDHNDNGVDDRIRGNFESTAGGTGALDGDRITIPITYGNQQTAMDVDRDWKVELPLVNDPSGPAADTYEDEYSRAQVLKHTITHEMGHAVGMNHNACSTCLMYEWSNNWSRDRNFSAAEQGEMYIHK